MKPPPHEPSRTRLVSLDAYRGFAMLAMLSGGLGFAEISQRLPQNAVWAFLAGQFNHVPWEGCSFWDLVQPSFMFIVGAAIPFSYASRIERGQTQRRIYTHALVRAAVLVALGLWGVLMLRRLVLFQPPWPVPIQTAHILVQIGITYLLAFPLVSRRPRTQFVVAAGVLAAYYIAFLVYPAAEPGLFAHWNKNTNLGAAVDRLVLPKGEYLDGIQAVGLTSLNFVPGVSTVLAGMLAGGLLLRPGSPRRKMLGLIGAGAACFVVGWAMGRTLCPIVKSIWTPSFAVYSAAWTLWLLAAFYGVIELGGWRRWSLPLVAVGLNPITLFILYSTVDYWIMKAWTVVAGRGVFESLYGPLWSSLAVMTTLLAIAGLLAWRRIYIRL